jgi:hypothetical protein
MRPEKKKTGWFNGQNHLEGLSAREEANQGSTVYVREGATLRRKLRASPTT